MQKTNSWLDQWMLMSMNFSLRLGYNLWQKTIIFYFSLRSFFSFLTMITFRCCCCCCNSYRHSKAVVAVRSADEEVASSEDLFVTWGPRRRWHNSSEEIRTWVLTGWADLQDLTKVWSGFRLLLGHDDSIRRKHFCVATTPLILALKQRNKNCQMLL